MTRATAPAGPPSSLPTARLGAAAGVIDGRLHTWTYDRVHHTEGDR